MCLVKNFLLLLNNKSTKIGANLKNWNKNTTRIANNNIIRAIDKNKPTMAVNKNRQIVAAKVDQTWNRKF